MLPVITAHTPVRGRQLTPMLLISGLEPIINILGDFRTVQATLKTHGKSIPLFDAAGKVTEPAYKATAPEFILIQGVLESGAISSINFRCTPDAVDQTGTRWVISGTDGELELDYPTGSFVQFNQADAKVTLRKWKSEPLTIDFKREEPTHVAKVMDHAINTARLYEAFATGDNDGAPSLEDTARVHELIEKIKKAAVWSH